MAYFPLRCRTHYSPLKSLSQPEQIADRVSELELSGCALTDIGNVSGCVKFTKELQKQGLHTILGCEFPNHILLAQSRKGWRELREVSSRFCNPAENENILCDDLLCIDGFDGSALARTIQTAVSWKMDCIKRLEHNRELFGKNNVYIGIDVGSKFAGPLRELSDSTNIPTVALTNSYYPGPDQLEDYKILICTREDIRITECSANYITGMHHIPSYKELQKFFTEAELKETLTIANRCKDYSILGKMILPEFDCPNEKNANEYLKELCYNSLKEKNKGQEYWGRLEYELQTIQGVGLSSYFLIMQDICNYVRQNNQLMSPGRGSAAGCLISYLIGITGVDPLEYGLIFERFYNAGRNTADHISPPDIDIDIPKSFRDQAITYVNNKYGDDKVAQLVTYTTLKGKRALKEVFRAYDKVPHEERNKITKEIIDESKIAGELQEMKEEFGESSIIRWALENKANKLREWCFINDKGNLDGPLAQEFEQAIRLEGTKITQSRHASGIVIGSQPLEEICPMLWDSKSKTMVAGLEMDDAEAIGLIKLDILGLNTLDKLMGVNSILETGRI